MPVAMEPATTTPLSMETLMTEAGNWGPFQWLMVATLKWGMMPIAWSMMQMSFAGMVPDWWCLPDHHGSNASETNGYGGMWSRDNGNWSRDNVTYEACEIPGSGGKSCAGHVVFDESVSTVVNEWTLVCDLSYVKGLMTSLQMGGVLFGALMGGQASDTFGRRPTVYVTILCHTITSLVAAFSVTWQMFVVMRVLIGVTLGLYIVASFSYPLEFIGPKYRQLASFIPGWFAGVAIFALLAWLFPNWRHLHIGSALLGVPFLLTFFLRIVPESARWLATKDRLQEAERVVQYVARVNRHPKPDNTLLTLQHVALEEKKAGQGRRYTYLDVYRGCRMAVTTLILNFIWFSLNLTYYGISFGVSALSGNIYLNIFLLSAVEVPSNLVSVFLSERIGRRWTSVLFFGLSGICSFAILVINKTVEDQGIVITVLALGTKLAVGSGWSSIIVLTAEQYPTVIRNLGFGASNTVSRVGGALAPLVLNMDTEDDVVRDYVIIGSLMIVCGLGTLLLRETKGQSLQDSIAPDNKVKDNEKVKDIMDQVKDNAQGEGQIKTTEAEISVWTVNAV